MPDNPPSVVDAARRVLNLVELRSIPIDPKFEADIKLLASAALNPPGGGDVAGMVNEFGRLSEACAVDCTQLQLTARDTLRSKLLAHVAGMESEIVNLKCELAASNG